MKETINYKSVIAGLIVLVIGIILIIYWENYGVSVGCSLIASSIVALLNGLFVERKVVSPLDVWGIKNIYPSRSRMNEDCDVSLAKAKYQVDVVAFGLQSYRTEQDKLTRKLLRSGVNFRIITMNPDSHFIEQREREENGTPGQIKNTIEQLIEWANKLNQEKGNKGTIEIKGYNCMTLDFYWRVDDDIYVGPYWYGRQSQQTISYKFSGKNDQGFNIYLGYFDELWQRDDFIPLETPAKAKRK